MSHYYFSNTPHGVRKNGTKINTKLHHDYICRQDNYAQIEGRGKEELLYTVSGNMPLWADSPTDFWDAAEKHRGVNGRAYREFKFALQEELTLAENIECVERLIKETGIKDNHAYSYAVHDKPAAFSKEHQNTHCHLMFNEKIIEKDRTLPADRYFKNYAKNKAGELTGGYRSSREFIAKEKTHELRKLYADIVNAKFKEKGLDCRIDERSLVAQYEDLMMQGKTDEAELVNRQPSIHLGNAYKNPATMQKIIEKIEETEAETEAAASGYHVQDNFSDMTSQEQKIALFANDVVIRQIARQLQQERARLKKEQLAKKAKIEAQEIQNEEMIITAGDVYTHLENKYNHYANEADKNLAEYKAIKAKILNEKQLEVMAKDRLLNGQYLKDIKEYGKIAAELKTLNLKIKSLYGNKDKARELASTINKERLLKNKRQTISRKLSSNKAIIENSSDKLNEIRQTLKAENEVLLSQNKKVYASFRAVQNMADRYNEAMQKLAKEDKSTILFADKIPAKINRKNTINGIVVGEMPTAVLNKDIYALTQEINPNIYKSVKLGDDIKKGSVPIYYVNLKDTSNPKVFRSYESAYLYDRKELPKRKREPDIVTKARSNRKEAIANKVSAIADKFVGNNNQTVKGRWHEDEQTKDKLKQTEKNMYQGWSL